MCRELYRVVLMGGVFLCLVTGAYAQDPAVTGTAAVPSADPLTQLRSERDALQHSVLSAKDENRALQRQLDDVRTLARWWERLALPFNFGFPFLAGITGVDLIPSAAFFCAGVALLIIVTRFPSSARRILDAQHLRNLPIGTRSDGVLPLTSRARTIWVLVLVLLLLLLAAPAFSQTTSEVGDSTPERAAASVGDIETLLKIGREKLALDRLTMKQTDGTWNAMECFDAVLATDPNNAMARAGLQAIVDRLVALAAESRATGDVANMERRLRNADMVVEGHASLGLKRPDGDEPSAAPTTPAADVPAAPSPTSVPATPASDEALGSLLARAVELMRMEPTDRYIASIERMPSGMNYDVTVPEAIAKQTLEGAGAHGHGPLLRPDNGNIYRYRMSRGNYNYWVLLAALYEGAGRPGAGDALIKALDAITDYDLVNDELDFAAYTSCLFKSEKHEYLAKFVPRAIGIARSAKNIGAVVDAAKDAGMQDAVIGPLTSAITRLSSNRDEALPLVLLLHSLGAKAEAETLLKELVAVATFPQAFSLLQWAMATPQPDILAAAIQRTLSEASLGEAIELAIWANGQSKPEVAVSAIEAAAGRVSHKTDISALLKAADSLSLMEPAAKKLSAALSKYVTMAGWEVESRFLKGAGVEPYTDEPVTLSSLVGAYLWDSPEKDALRQFFEDPVSGAVKRIIDTLGGDPKMPLNDVTLLAAYYGKVADPGKDAADKMVVLQRQLRGLDQPTGADTGQEAARLALEMEISTLKGTLASEQSSAVDLRERLDVAKKDLAETRVYVSAHIADVVAKSILLLIGLYIALLRSVAAARTVSHFRFSLFVWTFVETIGFEFCCTVVLVMPGAVLVVVAQDRLKHFSLATQTTLQVPTADVPPAA